MAKNLDSRLKDNLRRRLEKARKEHKRHLKAHELLGCTFNYFKKHIEKQFTEGMNWDNYGEWHIDHIKPCMTFDFSKLKNHKLCFNFKNLRPLWADDNRRRIRKC